MRSRERRSIDMGDAVLNWSERGMGLSNRLEKVNKQVGK